MDMHTNAESDAEDGGRPRRPGRRCGARRAGQVPGPGTRLQEKLKKKATEEEDGPRPGVGWNVVASGGRKVPRNVAVMARQYLGCPASSATVERLFSAAGISFSKARQRGKADTRQSIAFAHANM